MTIPFWLVGRSRWPAVMGRLAIGRPFAAWTIGPVICVPERTIAPQVLIHERRHVAHWWLGCALAVVLWAVVRPGWWWLLLVPFAYSLAYALAGLWSWVTGGGFYRGNWFERDARRAAGEAP